MKYPGKLIGRIQEKKLLQGLLETKESQLVAIVGRRRVGKTFLIKQAYQKKIIFLFTGQKNATNATQLANFAIKLQESYQSSLPVATPSNWTEAFRLLKALITAHPSSVKPVIFLDEVPWLAQPKSGFLEAFEYFWNDFAINKNIIVVICGSATSWMTQHILTDQGGLHNRVTKQIYLLPFTLKEVQLFLADRKIDYPYYDIIQLYMALGGIPYYLNEIEPGESVHQAIDRICFGSTAPLKGEFDQLYAALFNKFENHLQVVKALASKWKGLTRAEIIKQTGLTNGGGLTTILSELESNSFIAAYLPYGKTKREVVYRLSDEYSMFYLTFIKAQGKKKISNWHSFSQSAAYKSWSGFAFETLCLKHIKAIKNALGISGILTEESVFVSKDDPGIQIDLLIDRADNAINLCEMKFYNSEFILTSSEAQKIRTKKALFKEKTNSNKYLISTLITTFGMIKPDKLGSVDKVLTMSLFF